MIKHAIVLAGVLVPGVAAAHPNHAAAGDFGIVHLFTDPFHIALTATAVLLAFLATRLAGRGSIRRDRP